MTLARALCSLALCLFFPLQGLAQDLPEPLSDGVSDFADLLSPEAEARITDALVAGRAETGVHVVVVTMESIADFGGGGQRIEDYAKKLFNAWGVGDKARNDGILILVARGDREMRIALGAGYSVVWDNAAQLAVNRYFLPEFRADRYPEGIEAGVAGAYEVIARPFVAKMPAPETEPEGLSEEPLQIGFGVLGAMGLVLMAMRQQISNLLANFRTCQNCGHRGLQQTREIMNRATKTSSGHGETRRRCRSCDRVDVFPFTIAMQSDSDSGSSGGGFSGGSSSGGGASGKW
jgi:uncharacterized protein